MQQSISVRARPPFDFAATARFLRFTETEIVDRFSNNAYGRLFRFGAHQYVINVEARGTSARPQLVVTLIDPQQSPERSSRPIASASDTMNAASARQTIILPEHLRAAAQFVEHVFSVGHDLKGFRHAVAGDPLMSKIEAMHRGLRLARLPTLFESLTVSILLQQISTPVAITLKRRFVEAFGERIALANETLYAFPQASVLAHKASIEDLRALGISGAKARSIIHLAHEVLSGALDEKALARSDNEAIIGRLVSLRGVGRWTAEWALLLYFGRMNVFPAGDLALRNFIAKYYNDGREMSEREVRRFAAARWGAWASYVTIYIFAALRAKTFNLQPERVLSSG